MHSVLRSVLAAAMGIGLLSSLGFPTAQAQEAYVQHPNVLIVNYDPVLPSKAGRRVHDVFRWNAPESLNRLYRDDMSTASHGLVQYRIVQELDANIFPIKRDGFRYTHGDESDLQSYLHAFANQDFHDPDGVDYAAIVRNFDLIRKVEKGVVDEVWIQGAPYFGYYESRMVGDGAYWVNSPGLTGVPALQKFIIMGFNYERGAAEMLHSYGHRAESIMTYTYGQWDITKRRNDWEIFTHNVAQSGDAAVGTVHYPPNAESDYDYANARFVESTAPDWMENYPELRGTTSQVNRETWGGPDYHRSFMLWWYRHMPQVDGSNTRSGFSRLNNWWAYIQDFTRHEESGGREQPDVVQGEHVGAPVRLASDLGVDHWLPIVNDSAQAVWYFHDGSDYEIMTADLVEGTQEQLTDNDIDDVDPRLSDSGHVVWQAFDGEDYEIFTGRIGSSEVVQLTSNSVMDWHADINNSGRVVWDAFDGTDFEIFSASWDGSDVVQITDNEAEEDSYPSEDVWPRLNDTGRLVWMRFDTTNWNVYAANSDGSESVRVSQTDWNDEYPEINNRGDVVYFTRHFIDNVEIQAASADGNPDSERIISENQEADWFPRINDDGQVVWMGTEGEDWNIYSANVDGSGVAKISDGANDDLHPQIASDGSIVWQGHDGADWEIFLSRAGKTYQLSQNDVDDRGVSIGGGRAVWHARPTRGGASSVFASGDVSTVASERVDDVLPGAALVDIYPNPTRSAQTVRFRVREPAETSLIVYDMLGREVRILFHGRAEAGTQQVDWNRRDEAGRLLASGVYVLRLTTGRTDDQRLVTVLGN